MHSDNGVDGRERLCCIAPLSWRVSSLLEKEGDSVNTWRSQVSGSFGAYRIQKVLFKVVQAVTIPGKTDSDLFWCCLKVVQKAPWVQHFWVLSQARVGFCWQRCLKSPLLHNVDTTSVITLVHWGGLAWDCFIGLLWCSTWGEQKFVFISLGKVTWQTP